MRSFGDVGRIVKEVVIEEVVERADVGRGKRHRSRTAVLENLRVGQRAIFRAKGITQYASVRGSAYGYAKASGKRFVCFRLDGTTVAVRRMALRSGAVRS